MPKRQINPRVEANRHLDNLEVIWGVVLHNNDFFEDGSPVEQFPAGAQLAEFTYKDEIRRVIPHSPKVSAAGDVYFSAVRFQRGDDVTDGTVRSYRVDRISGVVRVVTIDEEVKAVAA